ncbi:carboxypeptidase-like regulatory domain-containing protein [Lewinella sp. IMCC34183]|uniref:carboxypeptidase-like regulatory domain-containing protein n=1 Tax=Lewinella sp. IMCC34183 TaxID=2248762 RepID=UPI000E2219A5|nr:carboxypeptidase-like regulatory domain-containing protein [Lewinella sp. IMCC34183]
MHLLRTACFLLCLLLAAGCEKEELPLTGSLEVTAYDQVGRPIPGATVRLTPGALEQLTDSLGRARFLDLATGTYDIEVSQFYFLPHATSLRITDHPVVRYDAELISDPNIPRIWIYSPDARYITTYILGDSMLVNADAANEVHGALTYAIRSDRDGLIGEGQVPETGRIYVTVPLLSSGLHTITITAMAATGHETSVALSIRVLEEPAPPTLLSATPTPEGVLLRWTQTTSEAFNAYEVIVEADNQGFSSFLTSTFTSTDTTFLHRDPGFGVDYTYAVRLQLDNQVELTSNRITVPSGVPRLKFESQVMGMLVDRQRPLLYVITAESPELLVYNTEDLTLVAVLTLPGVPESLAQSGDGSTLFLPLPRAGAIQLVDLTNQTVARTVPALGLAGETDAPFPIRAVGLSDGLLAYTGYGSLRGQTVVADAITGDTLGSYAANYSVPEFVTPPAGDVLFTVEQDMIFRYGVSKGGLALEQRIRHSASMYVRAYLTDDARFLVADAVRRDAKNLQRVLGSYPTGLFALSGDGRYAVGAYGLLDGETYQVLLPLSVIVQGASIDTQTGTFFFTTLDANRTIFRMPMPDR